MIEPDRQYLKRVIDQGLVAAPVLELGAGIPEHSARRLIVSAGLEYVSTDLEGDVDAVADFSDRQSVQKAFNGRPQFGTVLVFNVLEHTFDPIRVLDNVFSLLKPAGSCVLLTPTVWPLHSYPVDCWRILPDFYVEYARRSGNELLAATFEYVGVGSVLDESGTPRQLPPAGRSSWHRIYSRAVHKLLNTTGRGMLTRSHIATAVVIRKTGSVGS